MASLAEILTKPELRPQVVRACAVLIDAEVSRKSGFSGLAVKAGYKLVKEAGMLDTRTALVLVNLSIVLPYAVWMIKGFIDAVPMEIEESAMVDGAHRARVIWEIVVPTALPGIITAAVLKLFPAPKAKTVAFAAFQTPQR